MEKQQSNINPKTGSTSSSIVTVNDKTTTILSEMPLSHWRGPLTAFDGFTGTLPVKELKDATWDEIRGIVRPPEPARLSHKTTGQYILPALLKNAPFVGKTLEAAQRRGGGIIGKMRSKNHVIEASMLMFDIDGLPHAEFKAFIYKIKADGIAVLAYTTYSNGDPKKPGVRVRVIIPLDLPVGVEEYTTVWVAFDKHYFDGKVSEADPSGARLYQQQGTWCCHPDRVDQAESWSYEGGVASTDFLLELGNKSQPSKHIPSKRSNAEGNTSLKQLKALVNCIDPDCDYGDWLRVGMAMFHETKGTYDGLAVYAQWSSKGVKYKGLKDIEIKWKSFRLDVKNPVTIGTLIKMAKNAGADVALIMGFDEFEICETEVIRPSKWEVKS